jgi:hypothetical protein
LVLGIQSYLKCLDEDLDFGCVFLHNIFIICWSRKFKSKAKWTIFLCKCSVDNVHSISTNKNKFVICSYFKLCKSYITLHFSYCSMFSNNGVPFLKCQQYNQGQINWRYWSQTSQLFQPIAKNFAIYHLQFLILIIEQASNWIKPNYINWLIVT